MRHEPQAFRHRRGAGSGEQLADDGGTGLKLGAAAGRYFRRDGSAAHRVVIGKDTRLSGYMLENALTAGFTSTGMNVLLLGPVPTPAVGYLTRSMRADVGVMISRQPQPAPGQRHQVLRPRRVQAVGRRRGRDRGDPRGRDPPAQAENIGRAKRIEDGRGRYQEFVKTSFPPGLRLDGLKVVIDCANGAAYKARPRCCGNWGPR
jgi:phosphoglucosamine mutase